MVRNARVLLVLAGSALIGCPDDGTGSAGGAGSYVGSYMTMKPDGTPIECTNYYGTLQGNSSSYPFNRMEPCPSENAWGACVMPIDAKGTQLRSEMVYYDFQMKGAQAGDSNDYANLENGDACNASGLWRKPYDGTPPTTLPPPLKDVSVDGDHFTCDRTPAGSAHTCTEWTSSHAEVLDNIATSCQRENDATHTSAGSTEPCPTELRQFACNVCQTVNGEVYDCNKQVTYAQRLEDGVILPVGAMDISESTCGRAGGEFETFELPDSTPIGPHLSGATSIAAGHNYSCAVLSGGKLHCWGELGFNMPADDLDLSGLGKVTSVSISASGFACAIIDDGTVQCWGSASGGVLGSAQTITYSTTPIEIPDVEDATALALGQDHACALLDDGAVKCWGSTSNGQLGNGVMMFGTSGPVNVTGVASAVAIGAAGGRTCIVLASGALECWGLLSTARAAVLAPESVDGVTNAKAVALQGVRTCVLLADGTVQCWTSSTATTTAAGTTDDEPRMPGSDAELGGIADAESITIGNYGVCAAANGGEAVCWGSLSSIVTGSGFTATPVLGVSGATQLASGNHVTCALVADGAVMCWGEDSAGARGGRDEQKSNVPVYVLPPKG